MWMYVWSNNKYEYCIKQIKEIEKMNNNEL